jgi:predicted phage-related endonuclease
LIDGWDLQVRRVEYDSPLVAVLVREVDSFWVDHVVAGVPPAVESGDVDVAASRWPVVELDEVQRGDAADLARAYADARGVVKECQKAAERAKAALVEAIGAGEALVTPAGEVVATRAAHDVRRLNVDRLREDHPDLYEQYLETRPQRTLRLK